MSIVARVRDHLANEDRDAALAVLIDAWRELRAPALADAIDAIDAAEVAVGPANTNEWLAVAREANTPTARGALIRNACRRPAADIVCALGVAHGWQDPRVSTAILALLDALPFSGKRTRPSWYAIFAIVRDQRDTRFHAAFARLPPTWTVGDDVKRFLTNRFAEVIDGLASPTLPAPLAAELAALTAELRTRAARVVVAVTETSLLDAIYANPDDDAPRLVYADWLQERGDPRGEFIAMQLQPEAARDRKRERSLVRKHRAAWLGPLAGAIGGDNLEFRRGFVAVGTAKFRNQRDCEQRGGARAWATVEELAFSSAGARDDQKRWTRFVGPAMVGLRRATWPYPQHLLAATRPWRLEHLDLDARELDAATFRAICDSPMLPHLRWIGLGGAGDPSWLDGVDRCPELAVTGRVENTARWLEHLETTTLPRFTTGDAVVQYVFTRDPQHRFTHLAVDVVRARGFASRDEITEHVRYYGIAAALESLRAGSLTLFSAHAVLASGERVELRELAAAAAKALAR